MNTGHPRDVDPSITGQPHQATGEVPDLMGNITRTLGNPVNMPAAVRILVPPQLLSGNSENSGNSTDPEGSGNSRAPYAAPRCNASQTAVDSRAPNSVALPQ